MGIDPLMKLAQNCIYISRMLLIPSGMLTEYLA